MLQANTEYSVLRKAAVSGAVNQEVVEGGESEGPDK